MWILEVTIKRESDSDLPPTSDNPEKTNDWNLKKVSGKRNKQVQLIHSGKLT